LDLIPKSGGEFEVFGFDSKKLVPLAGFGISFQKVAEMGVGWRAMY